MECSRRSFLRAAVGSMLVSSGQGGTSGPLYAFPLQTSEHCASEPMPYHLAYQRWAEWREGVLHIRDFEDFELSGSGFIKRVFYRKNGPVVLILHELPGLTIRCVELGQRLFEAGFSPIMPLLFGSPLAWDVTMGMTDPGVHVFRNESHPVQSWLDCLVYDLSVRFHNLMHHGIGVIGMCLTGVTPLALLKHKLVTAPIVSQPAVPLTSPWLPWGRSDLGLSKADLATAKERVRNDHIDILAFRFRNDSKSPAERFRSLEHQFAPYFKGTVIQSPQECFAIDSAAHAVLTEEYRACPQDHPTHRAFREVVSFLLEKLD